MSHQIRVVLAVRAVFVFYDMQYRVMIIDFRIRPPFGEVLSMSPFDVRCSGFDPEYPGQMYGHIPPRSVQSRDISVFMDEMDAAGIDYAAVSGRASASSGIFSKGCVSLKWCMSWSTVIREDSSAWPLWNPSIRGTEDGVECSAAERAAEAVFSWLPAVKAWRIPLKKA